MCKPKIKINKPYNSFYRHQEGHYFRPYTQGSWCILQERPSVHNYRSHQCSYPRGQWSYQNCQHVSTWLLTISHRESQGNQHGDCLGLEQHLGGG